MDKYNVIIPTSNLDELNNDMVAWCNLPYNVRMRSDEECIRKYNMTNIDLYNKIKASIISNQIPEDKEMIANFVSEATLTDNNNINFDFLYNEDDQLIYRKQISKQLELSPNIVIISPFKEDEEEYSIEELESKFNKYNLLNPRNKLFSNSYSLNIWGYDVPNMYRIMKNKIISKNGLENDIIATLEQSKQEKIVNPLKQIMEQNIVEDNKLGLMQIKMDSSSTMDNYSKAIYESFNREIDKAIYEKDYSLTIPAVVPYFTIDEMKEFGLFYNKASNIKPEEYYKLISEKMNELKNSSKENYEKISEDILSLGWNPSVELNETNIQFARDRQSKWLNKKCCNVIDITKLNSVVNESTSSIRDLYKKNNLYPIYIVLTYRNALFSNIIKFVKHSDYTHAGLSLDSDLKAISTFQFGADWKGFANDSLDKFLTNDKNTLMTVLCVFVDKETKMKIEAVIKDFIKKQEKTVYGFGNLFNLLVNKSKDNDPENLYLVCSQFVDTVLKLANINLTNKSSNLVIPQDLRDAASNPKVYKVYEGLAKKYNEREVENLIYSLFSLYQNTQLKYMNINESVTNCFCESFFETEINIDKSRDILKEFIDLIKPESVLVEKKLPISITDKGDLIIKLYKSLEEEYQEAHRLLKDYGESNLEGIKHELARLFYINSAIEKKIKKMEKDDENYKKFIDLRARVLNDFKKYFKIVIEKEPDFNFSEYFQKSEYYNGNIIIDNSILKFTGNLIKKFLKSLGI